MIEDALHYPRDDDDWTRTVLIGGILSLLGALVVPTILVLGYLVRVLERTMHGDEHPPAFDEWGDMLVDGVKAFAITLAYGLVPAVLAVVVVAGSILPFTVVEGPGAAGTAAGGLGLVVLLVGGLLALVTALVAAYVVPAAIAALAETGEVTAGFSVSRLRPALLSGTYAIAWLWAFAVVVGAGLLTGALNAIPIIGFVIGGFVGFYAAVSAYYIVGRAWGDHRGLEPAEPGETPVEGSTV
ncbi:DUF4013 domain-containing protein [Halobellus ruber]|uniref:DUF4013 domain-containing protein n=1 Tax=Halobellus ruber TaxID=2761102 RepID=A0A7J9SJW3_9EURY|nr:DUF4013 domain-containing protein [Halobellus ruber]MBB6646287.1 DUF4013 domain-containing protein [Halobellus ruber]